MSLSSSVSPHSGENTYQRTLHTHPHSHDLIQDFPLTSGVHCILNMQVSLPVAETEHGKVNVYTCPYIPSPNLQNKGSLRHNIPSRVLWFQNFINTMLLTFITNMLHTLPHFHCVLCVCVYRALKRDYFTHDMIEMMDPSIMFAIPRLAIVWYVLYTIIRQSIVPHIHIFIFSLSLCAVDCWYIQMAHSTLPNPPKSCPLSLEDISNCWLESSEFHTSTSLPI